MEILEYYKSLPVKTRVAIIIGLTLAAHLVVLFLRKLTQWLLTPTASTSTFARKDLLIQKHPKFASLTTLVVSAATFAVYFIAIGLILKEFDVPLTGYLASASVIGLAIGFGSQGFVQDVVIGLTLIFTDAMNIGDMVQISGQIGKVERIGLRFTTIVNHQQQEIHLPNRTISAIGRYRGGATRTYIDIRLPDDVNSADVVKNLAAVAKGMHQQHRAIILAEPQAKAIEETDWKYVRVKFSLWPGEELVIESTFKQVATATMTQLSPSFAPWMITTTHRAR